MSSNRIVEPGRHVWSNPTNNSHQPSLIWCPRLKRSLLIAAHWTVRATHSKFSTPPIESPIATMLHLAPCPFPNTPMRALRVVEHIHRTSHNHLLWICLWYHLLECMISSRPKADPLTIERGSLITIEENTQTRTTLRHDIFNEVRRCA